VAEHLGATSYLYANTKVGEPVVVQAAAVSAHAGDRVAVSIPAARAYLFDPNGARRA
jgi:lactose/L-arabinose transport system ATP-binding protein